jgi:hypothetical protein
MRWHVLSEHDMFDSSSSIPMPIPLQAELSSVILRRAAFEHAELTRSEIDAAFNLTDIEFRVEGELVVIGPLPNEELPGMIADWLEKRGLVYFDDYFELSGNWPNWLRIFAASV